MVKIFCIEKSIKLFVTIKRSAWHSGEAGLSPGYSGGDQVELCGRSQGRGHALMVTSVP